MDHPDTPRTVALERDGDDQTLRIPADLALPGDTATIRREGATLVVEPGGEKPSLAELLASWEPLDEDFPEISDPPPEPVDL